MLCSLTTMSPCVPHAIDEVVHAVEIAQQRRLAAAGRADEGGDLPLRDVHRDVEKRLLRSVAEGEVLDLDVVVLERLGPRPRVQALWKRNLGPLDRMTGSLVMG